MQNTQATPPPNPVKGRLDEFYRDWAEIYKPKIEQIKKAYGWSDKLALGEMDSVAILADWYEFMVTTGLEKTLLKDLKNNDEKKLTEMKLNQIDEFERELKNFIATTPDTPSRVIGRNQR